MNREIKFRGFDLIANGWVFGGICFDADIKDKVYITTNYNEMIEVDPKSIGQFTGLPDKNKIDIYEGDIVKWKTTRYHTKKQQTELTAKPKWFKSPVLFYEGTFLVNEKTRISLNVDNYDTFFCCFFSESIPKEDFISEIVGNIYENPL